MEFKFNYVYLMSFYSKEKKNHYAIVCNIRVYIKVQQRNVDSSCNPKEKEMKDKKCSWRANNRTFMTCVRV